MDDEYNIMGVTAGQDSTHDGGSLLKIETFWYHQPHGQQSAYKWTTKENLGQSLQARNKDFTFT